ncbi:MAG: PAS domain S-box protein [Flavobacteriales bacterium]|nr:PAS domain S-box protein [Flavobacteriales bacterium]
MKKIQLLLIENSEEDAYAIAHLIGSMKGVEIEITHFQNLSESYSFLSKNKTDIILINLFLPDSYGLHTFDSLFKSYSNIPFLILTEIDDNSIAIEAVKKGAQDFIQKTKMDTDSLLKSIIYAIERKNSEKDLRRSEEKYRQLFLRSKDAIYMSTVEGDFIDINPSGLALFGYTIEDLKELKVKDLYVNKADRERLKEKLSKEGQVSDYEILLQKKDNKSSVNCLLSSMLIYDEIGKIIGYQGIIRDITEKKNAEQALFKSLADLDQANKELLLLNATLEDKVRERTDELLREKEMAEVNNKEINESIQYAKRIQASILPPLQRLKDGFLESFVYYEPKDVVSGDFYWYEKIRNKPLFAVVDCTGHGVPGAFMSLIGYTQLNEIVNQQSITDPGVILRELDKRVRVALHQNSMTERNSKDGMELGLIHVDYTQQRLEFAGAMRPLYLIRSGELHIYKGNKFSIGGVSRREKEFTTTRIKFQKGDCFYLFSDGYPDQFGGANGKKFMTRNVGEMLRDIAHLSMIEQQKVIKHTIQDWMSNEDQVDDILIAGVKF